MNCERLEIVYAEFYYYKLWLTHSCSFHYSDWGDSYTTQ